MMDIQQKVIEDFEKMMMEVRDAGGKTFVMAFKLTKLTSENIIFALKNAMLTDEKMDKLAEKQAAMDSVVSNYGDLKQKNRLHTVDIHEIPENIRKVCKKHNIKVGIRQSQQDGSYTVFFNPQNEKKMQRAVDEMIRNALNKDKNKSFAKPFKFSVFQQLAKTISDKTKDTIRDKMPSKEAR